MKIKDLIKKYNIYTNENTKGIIDQIEYRQSLLVCDGVVEWKELERLKVFYYQQYILEYNEQLKGYHKSVDSVGRTNG